MGKGTLIGWCDDTVNATTGCDGCELWGLLESRGGMPRFMGGPCYAGNYHETRMAKALPALYAPTFDEVRLVPGRMAKAASAADLTGVDRPGKPWLNGMPRTIFVGDLGDLFSKAVPFDYIESEVIDVARGIKGHRHVWMLLTKQPRRMAEFARWLGDRGADWPSNVWAGTSITSAKTTGRVERLREVPAAIRFLSVEPQFGVIEFGPLLPGISWVIQGGESDQGKHAARTFDVTWARHARDECMRTGTAYFLKQIGSSPYDSAARISIDGPDSHAVAVAIRDRHGEDWDEWPSDLRVRQMPVPRGAAVEAPRRPLPGQMDLFGGSEAGR